MFFNPLDRHHIVSCRGRVRREDTDIHESFTAEQLDALAPLERGDTTEMGELSIPGSDTIDRLQKRIEAAKRLKYGC